MTISFDHILTSEYFMECEALAGGQIEWLSSHGVSAETMINLQGPRTASVCFDGDRFELDQNGEPAFVIPCWRDGMFHDLLAWNASDTATIHCREPILGFQRLDVWCDHLRPLRVHSGVQGWLQSGLDGIVILEPKSAWRILWSFNAFEADSVEHGQKLRQILQAPQRNIEIHVPILEAAE